MKNEDDSKKTEEFEKIEQYEFGNVRRRGRGTRGEEGQGVRNRGEAYLLCRPFLCSSDPS